MDIGNTVVRGTLVQTSNSGIQIGSGTTGQRPANAVGLVRYNTSLSRLELNNGSTWANVGAGDGSVTSVALTGVGGAITVSGSPVTGSGTFTLALAGELAGVNAISTTGLVTRTAAGTYTTRAVTANTANGTQGLSVSNGDGVAGAPTISLNITGLNAAGALANTATFIVNDGSNNVKATLAQLLTLVDTGFVLQSGDTMTGALILSADPVTGLGAATKSYVDNAATTATTNAQSNSVLKAGSTMTGLLVLSADPAAALGAATKSYVDNGVANATQIAGNGLTLTAKTFSVNVSNSTTAYVTGNVAVRSSGTNGQVLRSSATAGVEATWGALDLAQSNAVTGVLPVANGGTGGANAAVARSNLGVPGVYRLAFTNANLVANALTVTHSLGQQFVSVSISDNTNKKILPDDITLSNSTSCSIDFTSFGALTGTWNVVVIG